MTTGTELPPQEHLTSIHGKAVRPGDRALRGASLGAGITILLTTASIALFLVWRALPALKSNSVNVFTSSAWSPDQIPPAFGIAALLFGTLLTSAIAVVLGVPVGIGIALLISHYAPKKLSTSMGFVTDLLAAVPSIIFGMWGLIVLTPHMAGLGQWMNDYLGFIPLFRNDLGQYSQSIFIAGVVLAIMILPTISALFRQVFERVPSTVVEASLALGATRWEMVQQAIFPLARPGIISAALLGLGRALGEAIAVALLLTASNTINWHVTEPAGSTLAANIALRWNAASQNGLSALIASGVVLFIITLGVNMVARNVISKHHEVTGGN